MLRRECLSLLGGWLCLRVAFTPAPLGAQQPPALPQSPLHLPDVKFVPTPPAVVAAMLRMAHVQEGDVLYDLGSGDGRIPIRAAHVYGIHAVGIDIDTRRIAEANEQAWTAGVTENVEFLLGDLFAADIREATVVTLYLLDVLNERLRPTLLRDLLPGTRIISHAFRMGDWEPEQTAEVDGHRIYLWTVPGPSASP
jgi:hypothetical protein